MGKARRKNRLANPDNAPRQAPGPRYDMPDKSGPGQVLAIEEFAEETSGSKRRVRNHGEHPLTLAFHRGQLITKYPDDVREQDMITAHERLAAGEEYRQHFEMMHRSGRDSTDLSGGGSGGGTPWTQTQAMAIHWVKRIEQRMHHRNACIIRRFCGEGCTMVEALRGARIDFHPDAAAWRVREALDDLVGATTGRRFTHSPQNVP